MVAARWAGGQPALGATGPGTRCWSSVRRWDPNQTPKPACSLRRPMPPGVRAGFPLRHAAFFGAGGGPRTHTGYAQRILSPPRLPIPTPRHSAAPTTPRPRCGPGVKPASHLHRRDGAGGRPTPPSAAGRRQASDVPPAADPRTTAWPAPPSPTRSHPHRRRHCSTAGRGRRASGGRRGSRRRVGEPATPPRPEALGSRGFPPRSPQRTADVGASLASSWAEPSGATSWTTVSPGLTRPSRRRAVSST